MNFSSLYLFMHDIIFNLKVSRSLHPSVPRTPDEHQHVYITQFEQVLYKLLILKSLAIYQQL